MPTTRRRQLLALALLLVLVTATLALTPYAGFRGAPSVDSRTYIEMTRGFADHGLPYLDNGPSGEVAEMRARWNVFRGGHLWGIYPPLFPLLGSLVFPFGGSALVSQWNFAVSALLTAFAAYALGARLTRDPLAGAGAAFATTFGTFLGCLYIGLDSFGLVTAFAAWSCYFGLRTVDTGSRPSALLAGALGAAATASHLIALPMCAGTLLAIALARHGGEGPLALPLVRRFATLEAWAPSRGSVTRALLALLGLAVGLVPVGLLNRLRFGSSSPVTYGPCVWKACTRDRLAEMTLGHSIAYAIPLALWAAASAAVLALLLWRWRRPAVVLLWGLLALGVLALVPTLREHAEGLFESTIGYVVDNAAFKMGPLHKPADGLGNLLGPFVVKSLLQGSPFMALAFVAPWVLRDRDAEADTFEGDPRPVRLVALLAPACALVVLLALRGNLPLVHALGFPFLILRYLAPVMPILAVVSVAVARRVGLGALGWVALLAVALSAGYYLWGGADAAYARRVLLLRVTLAAGIGAAALAVLRGRFPRLGRAAGALTGVAFGLAVAISCGVDDITIWNGRNGQNATLRRIEAHVPPRFALVGWAPELDPALALRASHDIEYIDFVESDDWSGFRRMLDRWTNDGIPVFAVFPVNADVASPWPDVRWEPLDPEIGLVRVVRDDAPRP